MRNLLIYLILLFNLQMLLSQEASDNEATDSRVNTKSEQLTLIQRNTFKYNDYNSFTNFQGKTPQDEDYELYRYNWVTNSLKIVEKDLMKFFFSKLSYNYNKKRKDYDLYSVDFFEINFFSSINFSESSLPYVMNERLEKIGSIYKQYYEGFVALGVSPDDLEDLIMKEKVLDSIILYAIGGEKQLKKAISNFEFLLGANVEKRVYITKDDNKRTIYKYLISLYKQIGKYYVRKHDRKEKNISLLYYRWKLAELINKDNEELKNFKMAQLVREYYPYMSVDSQIFEQMYKKYVIDLYNKTYDISLKYKLMDKFGAKFFDPGMELD